MSMCTCLHALFSALIYSHNYTMEIITLVLLIIFVGLMIYMTNCKEDIVTIDMRTSGSSENMDIDEDEYDINVQQHFNNKVLGASIYDPNGGPTGELGYIDNTHIRGRRANPTSTADLMKSMMSSDADMSDNVEGLSNNYDVYAVRRGLMHGHAGGMSKSAISRLGQTYEGKFENDFNY